MRSESEIAKRLGEMKHDYYTSKFPIPREIKVGMEMVFKFGEWILESEK